MNFFKKHKKSLIISGVILLIFIVLIILMFTLFSLKKVEVNYLTSTSKINEQMESDIIAEIDLGGTVLFKDKDKIVKDLEYKFPYVKVVNIETVFPNKFVVNVAERQGIFCINNDILLDADLKVLEKGAENISLNVLDLEFNTTDVCEGQFFSFEDVKSQSNSEIGKEIESILKQFSTMLDLNNKNITDVKNMFKQINVLYYTDFRTGDKKLNLQLIDQNNFEVNIYNPLENYENKVYKMFYAYSDVYASSPEKIENSRLIVYTKLNGEDCAILETI